MSTLTERLRDAVETPPPGWVAAVWAAVGLAVTFDILVMFSVALDAMNAYRTAHLPRSGTAFLIAFAVLLIGVVFARLWGNWRARHHDIPENVLVTLAVPPVAFVVGMIMWSLLGWLLPLMSPGVRTYVLAVVIGGVVTGLLLDFCGPGAAYRARREAAWRAGAEQRDRRSGPTRGQVWWAIVPYVEKIGSKTRPVLVLDSDDTHVWCLYFTSVDQSVNRNFIPAPEDMWNSPKEHSYLRLDRPLQLARRDVTEYECLAPELLRHQADQWADNNPKATSRPRALR